MKRIGRTLGFVFGIVILTLAIAGARTIPGYQFSGATGNFSTFSVGEMSNAGIGWTWHTFDVSGTKTGEPDKLAYNPQTGQYVLVITDHYQFHGLNGTEPGPGDCYVVGSFAPGRVLTIEDMDRDGQPDVFAYSPVTGAVTRYYFRSFGACDWTDAF